MKFKIKNKKQLIKIFIIVISALILVISIPLIKGGIENINKNGKAEQLTSFNWEITTFTLNNDYSYTLYVLVKAQEENGIEYISYNIDGKDNKINANGKQKLAFDAKVQENKEYDIKIKPVGKEEKIEKLKVGRKVAGEGTYKKKGNIYVNEPYLENFNEKYTRYLGVTENNKLIAENWIFNEEPENWYNYEEQKWANVYVEYEGVENYFVWIPRYMYKIVDGQRTDVKFVDVYNNYKDGITEEITPYSELLNQGYVLPDAFEFGDGTVVNEGLLKTQLSGYWISKYQLATLDQYKLDFNMTANKSSILIRNFTNNLNVTPACYTYAINGEIKNTPATLEEYTFINLENKKTYTVNITALDEDGQILGSMTKTLEATDVNPPNLDGFNKDVTFYVYWDENGIEHNEIPITQDPPEGWYDYTFLNWANIVVRNDGLETYYVWIPRYQYSLKPTSQRSDVKFIIGTGTQTTEGYLIPDAFWWDKNDNGAKDEGEQLTGYWITKYQLAREEVDSRISAEISPASNCIHIKDIKGTALTTKDDDGNTVNVPLKYEYYLDGVLKYNGTESTENYTYEGLNIDTTYTVNIIARNAETDKYIGAITKQVTTKAANDPDLSKFMSNDGLKEKTYYVIYSDDMTNIEEYVPITEEERENWYDYSKSKWANIVVTNGTVSGNTITDATQTSYFVWIPRYEYKILQENGDWSNLNKATSRTDVRFLTGTETQTTPGYIIPDAFWWDKNDNGTKDEGEQLTGYWISKYQLSNN